MASAPKPKKRKPPHIGRPAYEPHQAGYWNKFDTYLSRRRVWAGERRATDMYDWVRGGKQIHFPHFGFKGRNGTKREERGAGAVKKMRTSGGRKFQQRRALEPEEGRSGTSHGSTKCERDTRMSEKVGEVEEFVENDQDEKERSKNFFDPTSLEGIFAEPSRQGSDPEKDSSEEDGEWIHIRGEDDSVEIEDAGMVLEGEDEWAVV